MTVKIIGAGLAGSEAALTLAANNIDVELYDCKPSEMSPAHHSPKYGEVVCSNSFKSDDPLTASGMLKAELRFLGSRLITIADMVKVPAGSALAVDREMFSALVTEQLCSSPHIKIINSVVSSIDFDQATIIATGPLTLPPLSDFLTEKLSGGLYFYDAEAPIISADSVDYSRTFEAGRYGKGDDYINCPLSKSEYYEFVRTLITADRAILKDFEKDEIFEGCMPIEVMALRGVDTLRFGPLKSAGVTLPDGTQPFAVVQLRKENDPCTMYNIVGFQTNLKFSEQKRVFGLIPALKNAEFLRYGVMHKNMYINAPKVIDRHFRLKSVKSCFIAGQLGGVEGYVESIASGLIAALNMKRTLRGEDMLELSPLTMIGALCAYIERINGNFQPMNANHGLLPPLKGVDKSKRKEAFFERSMAQLKQNG